MRVQCEQIVEMRRTCALLDLWARIVDVRDAVVVRVHGGRKLDRAFTARVQPLISVEVGARLGSQCAKSTPTSQRPASISAGISRARPIR